MHTWWVSTVLLDAASLLVPRESRLDWLAEWKGELWHVGAACGAVRQRPTPAVHGDRRITMFCLGAFQDALLLRLRRWSLRNSLSLKAGTPARCMLLFSCLFAISMICALCMPNVRAALWSTGKPLDNLALVTRDGYLGDTAATMEFSEYRAWKANPYPFARRLVFYRVQRSGVRLGASHSVELKVAYASQSLLSVLAPGLLSKARQASGAGTQGGVFVSRKVWRDYLAGAANISEQTMEIEGQQARVIGIAPESSWPVPGGMDLILLETDAQLAASSMQAPGFLLAPGIGPFLYRDDPHRPYILANRAEGGVVRYECATLGQRRDRPTVLFLLAVLLACVALPATTPLPLGEYSAGQVSRGAISRMKRYAFLMSKVSLALLTVYLVSLIVAYAPSSERSPRAECLQLLCAFLGLLFALRWIIRDQRSRCPTCLCVLTGSAHVGHASRFFLEWHGTEMLCTSGHGLLYIPEHPTSWFSMQRWQPLDASWASLFSR